MKKGEQELLPPEDQSRNEDTGQYEEKLSEEAVMRIAQAVRAGSTFEGAARYAGVARATFYRWLSDGRRLLEHDAEPGSLRRKLVEELDRALGDFEAGAVARIQKAGEDPRHWQANAWLLERRMPDDYGRRQRIEVGDSDDPRVRAILAVAGEKLDVSQLSDDDLDALIELTAKMVPEDRRLSA